METGVRSRPTFPPRSEPLSWLFLLIGVVVLFVITWQVVRTAAFLATATRTVGTVVENTGHPTIRFRTAEGTEVRFVQNGFVARPAESPVPVAYDPRAPEMTARADIFMALWGQALWLLPMGLGFTLLPLFGVQVGRSTSPSPRGKRAERRRG